ncbi:phosducin-like protein, putative [Plasmodium ovale]|uniref:Phosducin-like protein, putative n=2 Tax=Plasmodium ovale TaxID=36330 RepID=A0A1D3U8P5_PLAOA|nr:phosducin-like protein, putative (PhLP3) [Plasmodium ovale curtisi]SBS92738.1 phosducin-like protein, putative (PhLP3) [Plasmodium ovale curtisi]SCQ16501.1 phosducin-like protein, putative [Plasmodium ovale]
MSTTNPTRETTEWDDLQRKYGNLPPLEKEIKEEEIYLTHIDKLENENFLKKKKLSELTILEEDCVDDEYAKIIEKYRNNRINEININRSCDIYGEVYYISKDNFITEINEASKRNPLQEYVRRSFDSTIGDDGEQLNNNSDIVSILQKKRLEKGTYVVIHLYSDNIPACTILNNILIKLASKYKYIKFTKGVYSNIVENYPESKVPTILIYYNGSCLHQIGNFLTKIKGGINNLTVKSVEKILSKYGILKRNHYIRVENSEMNEASEISEMGEKSYIYSTDGEGDNAPYEKKKKNIRAQKQYSSFNPFSSTHKSNANGDTSDSGDSADFSPREGGIASKGYASSCFDRKVTRGSL